MAMELWNVSLLERADGREKEADEPDLDCQVGGHLVDLRVSATTSAPLEALDARRSALYAQLSAADSPSRSLRPSTKSAPLASRHPKRSRNAQVFQVPSTPVTTACPPS